MRQSRFTETEIVYAVKHLEPGISVQEISRKYGVSDKTVYLWLREYNGPRADRFVGGGPSTIEVRG